MISKWIVLVSHLSLQIDLICSVSGIKVIFSDSFWPDLLSRFFFVSNPDFIGFYKDILFIFRELTDVFKLLWMSIFVFFS